MTSEADKVGSIEILVRSGWTKEQIVTGGDYEGQGAEAAKYYDQAVANVLAEYQAHAKAKKLFVTTLNQREQEVTVRVNKVTSIDEQGRLVCWTTLTPLSVKPFRLCIR